MLMHECMVRNIPDHILPSGVKLSILIAVRTSRRYEGGGERCRLLARVCVFVCVGG